MIFCWLFSWHSIIFFGLISPSSSCHSRNAAISLFTKAFFNVACDKDDDKSNQNWCLRHLAFLLLFTNSGTNRSDKMFTNRCFVSVN